MSEQECTGVIQNSPLRSFFGDTIMPVYLIFITFTQKNEMTGETNESMIINKNEIAIKPIQEEDIPLFDKWLDKEYISKWFGKKEDWLNEIHERNGEYSFLHHFIVYCNDRKIGYCLYADCFFLKNLEEEGHDFEDLYGDVPAEKHTYEIGYLIGEEEYLNHGIGKIIIRILEEKIMEAGGKEISADPSEENIISIKALLSNGFKKKRDGDYRKVLG